MICVSASAEVREAQEGEGQQIWVRRPVANPLREGAGEAGEEEHALPSAGEEECGLPLVGVEEHDLPLAGVAVAKWQKSVFPRHCCG